MNASTPAGHHERAVELLGLAQRYAPNSPARMSFLSEAQVHATLALGTPPLRYMTGLTPPDEETIHSGANYVIQAMNIPLDEAAKPDAEVIEVPAAKPAPKRRTRKPAAKDEEAAK